MNNKNNISFNGSFITAGILFIISFLFCIIVFNTVGGMSFFPLVLTASFIMALMCVFLVCIRYAKANKIKNPDAFNPPRDTFYYLKRMGFAVLMTFLMSMGVSFIGTFASAIFTGMLNNNTDSLFLRGFLLKLPMFIIYLSFIYKMYVRYGFIDCEKKIYNFNFKFLTVIASLIFMIPNAVYDSMFYTAALDTFIVNVQTVLSPNVDKYIMEFGVPKEINKDFNIILVAVTILLTFAAQTAVSCFAYKRGKQIFIKEHIRKLDEYEMDENI
ncbi:MAG: hypothetical protein FWF92_10020 [Oscillospiraceae bacterium]|nr:hypothetical protein [Oscillospiraceae bacterium]